MAYSKLIIFSEFLNPLKLEKEDEDILHVFIGKMFEGAHVYYQTKEYIYYMYCFENPQQKMLLKMKRTGVKTVEFDDFQAVFTYDEPEKFRLVNIDKEHGRAEIECLASGARIDVTMDCFDFQENDEVYVYVNIFPTAVFLSKSEAEYQRKHETGNDISQMISQVGDFCSATMRISEDVSNITLPRSDEYNEDDFRVVMGSGIMLKAAHVITKMPTGAGNKYPMDDVKLGANHLFEFHTNLGRMTATVSDFVFTKYTEEAGISGEFTMPAGSVIEVYGFASAWIKIDEKVSKKF